MVPEVSPVIGLVKAPVPVPFVVQGVVGFADVPQQTPLAVTFTQPSEVTFPPGDAVVSVMKSTPGLVVTVGVVGIPKDTWEP